MKLKKTLKILLFLSFVAMSCLQGHALINPNFTPVNLVKDAQAILILEFSSQENGKSQAKVKEVLKGSLKDKMQILDFTKTSMKQQAKALSQLTSGKEKEIAMFFIGSFDMSGQGGEFEEMGEEEPQDNTTLGGYMHIQGTWAIFTQSGPEWIFENTDAKMKEVWRGGTDMLIRCCKTIIADESTIVPVAADVDWGEELEVASLKDRVNDMYPVTIDETGKLKLYLSSKSGDKLFEYDNDGEKFNDITEQKKLSASSIHSTWGDFDKNGKAELVSWNGKTLSIYTADNSGLFSDGKKLADKSQLGGDCLSISTIDLTGKGQPALLLGTESGPVILSVTGEMKVQKLNTEKQPAALGKPGKCLIADLDGDALPDILHLYTKGSLLYKATAIGKWDKAIEQPVALGERPNGAFFADFDADGLLDIVTYGKSGTGLAIWQNTGSFNFVESKGLSGECYNTSQGISKGMLGDINNDGHQDFIAFYSDQSEEPKDPQIYFNRGYRSFGLAADLNLSNFGLLPDALDGQQTGCWGDFNNDGAQDLVLVDANNKVGMVHRNNDDEELSLRVMIPGKASYTGPVKVTAYNDGKCLGAWHVAPNVSEAIIATDEAGEFELKWQLPGGKVNTHTIILEEGASQAALTNNSITETK